jgi:hypothetical protein
MTDERINTGYAALQTDSDDVPVQVSGVAIGENDVTRGGSGKETLWPRETLEDAAEGLIGQPLATDTDHTADDPKAQTPVEAIAGEVTWAGYKPGVGVLYEAEVDDESLAQKIENGRLEVSPLVSRELEALEDGDADYKATNINRWRDLALVAQGAAPSNEITVGGNPMKAEALHAAVEALQDGMTPPEQAQENAEQVLEWRDEHGDEVDAMTDVGWERAEQLAAGEELSAEVVQKMAQFNRHRDNADVADEFEGEPWKDNGHVAWLGWGGDAGIDWAIEKSEELSDESMASTPSEDSGGQTPNAEALKEVAGVSFDGTAEGELDESEIPNDDYESHYLYPADTKTDSSYPVVDADGNLRKGNVDAAWGLGARGGVDAEEHDRRLMALAEEFDNPPEWATDEEAMSGAQVKDPALWEACSLSLPESFVADPAESGRDTQSDDGTDGGGAPSSVAATDSDTTMTELSDDEKAILQAAEGVDEPAEALNEYAATEGPTIVAQDEYEAMQDNIQSVRGVMEEALCERSDLKESTVQALDFEALRAEFETEDGDLDAEALVQNPETGDPDVEESGVEALGDDADVDKAEALYGDYQTFGTEGLKEDITEALGVSDFEEAEEVLN